MTRLGLVVGALAFAALLSDNVELLVGCLALLTDGAWIAVPRVGGGARSGAAPAARISPAPRSRRR